MADDVDGAFTSYAAATVDGLLERQPEWATSVGDHRHDDRITVGTAAHYEQAAASFPVGIIDYVRFSRTAAVGYGDTDG